MNIQKSNFKFTKPLTPLNLNLVTGIALHHMAHPTWTELDVHNAHLKNKWLGIGYNYFVDFDGTVIEGRGFNQGAGVEGLNSTIISVGFRGNYHSTPNVVSNFTMPDKQFNSGVELIYWIKSRLPKTVEVDGHNKWNNTSCPGKFFPLEEFKKGKLRGGNTMNWEQKAVEFVEAFQEKTGLKVDGQAGSETFKALEKVFVLTVQEPIKPSSDDWKLEGLTGLYKTGLLNDFEGWAAKKDDPAPIWMVAAILNRIYQDLKGGK